MAANDEKTNAVNVVPSANPTEKLEHGEGQSQEKARLLGCSPQEYLDAEEYSKTLDLADALDRARDILAYHDHDPNFNRESIVRLQDFVNHPDLFQNPNAHADLISEIKVEISLLTENSPYAEVRAVVSNKDDESAPAGTIRAWVIGLSFVILVSFVNQLFSVRQPAIWITGACVQLLSFPLGRAWERWLPVGGFSMLGSVFKLNPGRFNQKEHMLISIMADVAVIIPHSRFIIFTTWMERYFNLPFAGSFGFQICASLSMNLMGFGLAGLARRFLVYPSYCIWPRSLVTVALNQSLHEETSEAVPGPFKRLYSMSRYKFFLLAFGAMFVWFWVPQYLVTAVSLFNWIAWIAPDNFTLTAVTGLKRGLGFNPFPTLDWNVVVHNIDPWVVPFHVTFNLFVGVLLGGFVLIAIYWTNTYNTGYLPINTNNMYTNNGSMYNVSAILDDKGLLDTEKYLAYSPVYIAAVFFFAVYSSLVSYAILYHRKDIALGFRSLFNSFKKNSQQNDFKDIHSRLMRKYREVPEWWYLILNAVAIGLGIASVAGWPTNTSVGVIFFGIALAIVFTIPTGIIYATTGIPVEYNVLAEFIGGAWQPGNALAMNFLKGFGYVTVAHALDFANDLKLGHYLKIPPWQTFFCQVVATTVSAIVCTGVMNFQITHIPDICSPTQRDRFTCPGLQSYFTAAVLFGSLSAKRIFGAGAQYTALLAAFPAGLALPPLLYYSTRHLPPTHWLTKIILRVRISGPGITSGICGPLCCRGGSAGIL
ncbi:OPT oligopeptide transporter protein-domain-containing protein [Aspergillus karnatakaensis]|uniref:OPT oligopeptide transporter protein-domain-containing protein n=1 Tax=Aspergillus karnatakaensis TaxID=1810916 RepID=UPI003CCE396A